MSQKIGFLISAALTAFILVIGGAVAGRVSAQNQRSQKTGEESAVNGDLLQAELTSGTDMTQSEMQVLLERESSYHELISQANARMQALYAEKQSLEGASQAAFSPYAAGRLVQGVLPNAMLLEAPRMVNFQGLLAYEIELDQGMVYVDANSGEILFSTFIIPLAPMQQISPPLLGSGSSPGRGISLNIDDDPSGSNEKQENHGEDSDDDHEEDKGEDDGHETESHD